MRKDAYRAFLERRGLGMASAASYVANARRLERSLNLDLDLHDLSQSGIEMIRAQLADLTRMQTISHAKAGDCLTAVRRYAEFRELKPEAQNVRQETVRGRGLDNRPSQALIPLSALFDTYNSTLDSIRAHGFLRTENGILSDYAEHLFATAFDWKLETNSRAGHDAVDVSGHRYQIKARRLDERGSRQLSALRRLPEANFDTMAAALFHRDFSVRRAIFVPWKIVAARAAYIKHTNSWRFMLDDVVWDLPGIREVTLELRAAALRIDGNMVSKPLLLAH